VEQLLPVGQIETPEDAQADTLVDYVYEQPAETIFGELLPKLVENQVYHALLESVASELGSRMTAMDSASKNASEVIDKLTLVMNRVRQAKITREIIEVVSGAEAL
jgi:F-type H+-transporting ATPase subunit gamma